MIAVDPFPTPGSSARDRATDVLRRAVTVRSRIAECEMTVAQEYARLDMERQKIDLWCEQETASDRQTLALLIAEAEAIARERLASLEDGDKKELTTPFGEIEARKAPAIIERDQPALDAWAADNGYTRTRPEETVTDWARIKGSAVIRGGRMIFDGRVVDGVTVREPEQADTLTVKLWL